MPPLSRRRPGILAALAVAVVAAFGARAVAEERPVEDAVAGLAAVLPSPDWRLQDLSSSGVVCHVYAKAGGMVPRVTFMRYPRALLPEGLASRAAQVENVPGHERLRFEPGETAGRAGHVYEYRGEGTRTVERGFGEGERYWIVQVAAPEADWADAAKAAAYARVFATARRLDAADALPTFRVDPKTPEKVRAARAAARRIDSPFSIREHDVLLRVEPVRRRLDVSDRFLVEAREDGVWDLTVYSSHVGDVAIRDDEGALSVTRHGDRTLSVRLRRPLGKGERRTFRFTASAEPLDAHEDQRLIAEISMQGQVTAESSFSTHVLYYPIDAANDASVALSISVPEGYKAVSGGEDRGSEVEPDGRRVFRFAFPTPSPRLLPAGFSVARYGEVRGKTADGLEIVVHPLPGHEREARQRLAVALECGALFERWMGPLPWRRVAICEVKPLRKETCVSLPGQILLSGPFFGDIGDVEPTANLDDPKVLGVLGIADEMSHQWNAYATPLPNEFAEGVSTFTNLLYLETRRGVEEYRKGLRYCGQIYLSASETATDVALADPVLYASEVYRAVAFCKVPVVLALLRRRLGDEVFFRAWRESFAALRGRRADIDDFERAFSSSAKQDLSAFFRQWFFQAGHPVLDVSWSAMPGTAPLSLSVSVTQAQPGGTFALDLPIEVSFDAPTPSRTVTVHLTDRVTRATFALDAMPRALKVDPEGILPIHARVVRAP